jgi:hypothetical protein
MCLERLPSTELADLAQELGVEPLAEEARELTARISEERFYVTCAGQFKRAATSPRK